jgi:hypothetical protein
MGYTASGADVGCINTYTHMALNRDLILFLPKDKHRQGK